MYHSTTALGIDIGGSFIKAALVDCVTGALLSEMKRFPTPQSPPREFIASLAELIRGYPVADRVGIGFPGVVQHGVIRTAVHLHPHWIGYALAAELGKLLDYFPTAINDADAAGIAELRFGAGKGVTEKSGGVVLVITLGTGIGSALFLNGELVPNTEFGHIYLEDNAEAETVAAASMRTKLNLSWEEFGRRVDRYLNYLQKLIRPDLIILGGGVSENWEQFTPLLSMVEVVRPAQLGNSAGLIGAALSGHQVGFLSPGK